MSTRFAAFDDQDRSRGAAPSPTGMFPGKLRPPPAGEFHVRRLRLEHTLDHGVDRGIVIVAGPAGSGKTQLVAAWAHAPTPPGGDPATSREVAWVTLGESDRDPAHFVRYVVGAIALTRHGRHVEASRLPAPPAHGPDEAYLVTVSDALSRLTGDVVVVLDDFQTVIGSASERLLGRILRYQPERVRLVVLSRVEPHLHQTRLRLQGRLLEIAAADLALSRAESVELFGLHGLVLSDAQVDLLQARTHGWTTGSQVFGAAIRQAAGPESFAVGVDTGEAFVQDHLRGEVFEREPAEVQDFLLRAATADPVCGELADALSGRPGGDRTLDDMSRAHLFLEPLKSRHGDDPEDERTWYCWHPMFLTFLHRRLGATDRAAVAPLHRVAATWHHEHGSPVEAVRHALAADDAARAAHLLGESWIDMVLGGESRRLRPLLAAFEPEEVERSAELSAVCGFARLQEQDLAGADDCVQRAEALSAELPEDRRLSVAMMTAAIRLHAATMTGEECAASAYRSALSLAQQPERDRRPLPRDHKKRRALLLYHLGAYEVSRWWYDEPRQHLNAAVAIAGTLGLTHLVLRARAQLAFVDFFSGKLDSAREAAREVVDAAEGRGWHSHHSLATAYHALGGVDVFRGDFEAGLETLTQAQHLVDEVDEVNRFRIGFTRHVGLRALGDVRDAREELERMQAQQRRWASPPPWAAALLAVAEGEQLALEGSLEQALTLVDVGPLDPADPVAGRHWQVFRSQLLLRSGRPAQARAVLEDLPPSDGAWLIDIRARVVDAVAAEVQGRHEDALHSLAAAVEQAAAEKVREPFLVSGPQVRPLLQELVDRGAAPHDTLVLDLLDRLAPSRVAVPPTSPWTVVPLTAREHQVLGTLQGNASYGQIADRLSISLNTFRTHTKHIHRKLGTTSRREAVQRARDLGIL